jgi:hypothetical protein
LEGTEIWAIHLPNGPVYRTPLAQSRFAFEDVPVGRYVLAPNYISLAERNLHASALSVDLYESTEATVFLTIAEGKSFSGAIRSREGSFLPFAWIDLGDQSDAHTTDPVSGKYLFYDFEAKTSSATASAPGYYSLSQSVASLDENHDFHLVPRPQTQFIKWGNSTISLPPETNARINGSDITLEHGWLWGGDNTSAQAIQINLPGLEIHLTNGRFALEYPADGTGWLYMYQGEADVVDRSKQAQVQVRDGEMIALMNGAKPLRMESAVAMALHPPLREPPVFEIIEPSLGAKIQNWLARAGIGVMQMITFITYILSLVTLIAIIFHAVFSKRKKSPSTEEKS